MFGMQVRRLHELAEAHGLDTNMVDFQPQNG
jgi:hypothetical protein